MAGRRIAVVGTTGTGKTTLAAQVARRLGLPHVELDALSWGPNWTTCAADLFVGRVEEALRGDEWVVDGNYSKVRHIVWRRADTLVWLDYPFVLVIGRLFRRTVRRIVRQEMLWGVNRESWRAQFLSRDSLFVWAVKSHWRRRRQYRTVLQRPEYAHLKVVRLRSPRATRAWLDALTPGQ